MISVLTLVHGRSGHLDNVLAALGKGSVLPDEVRIVHMNERAVPRKSDAFPIVVQEIFDADTLPLAAARNDAARAATHPHLIFLDVDCIPGPALVSDYATAMRRCPTALHQGEVRYLPAHIDATGLSASQLEQAARCHPLHADRPPDGALPYNLFWSLNFACTKAVFATIGGFDAAYRGYGGEDTDFSFCARREGISLCASRALAFHQYHPTYDPPLNHFADIVGNATVFRRKWGVWPMQGWLDAFLHRGFIQMREDRIEITAFPTDRDIAACSCDASRGF
jgi:GT2 family glycosyltransferase